MSLNVNILIIFNFLLFFSNISFADDVLGCNGFVKSDINLKYPEIEVKLFTKQGSLKDHTECAPNSGYYFLPLYDKGEYVLKIVPPEGWSFEPSEVLLSVDGVSDPCSQGKDINFEFKGFAVTGRVVSFGHEIGPNGVNVDLISATSNTPILKTVTGLNGDFMFTPVLPGDYKVRISHDVWKLKGTDTSVKVISGNARVPDGVLSVLGYDVMGSVTSDNQPITGVSFVLFSKKKLQVGGCDVSPLPDFTGQGLDGLSAVCHVSSDPGGVFSFPQLPPAEYLLVPHYSGSKSTKFDVQPSVLSFTVQHGSLQLPTPFEVKGFSVSGRVLWSRDGKPMSGVTVSLNGKEVGKTGPDGVYNLESMKAGQFKLKVHSSNGEVTFDETEIKVSSTSLPDLVPTKYRTCGKMYSQSNSGPYKLNILSTGSDIVENVQTEKDGKYCILLSPGKYQLVPSVEDASKTKGLLFSPATQSIQVVDNVLDNIDFSQLRSTVRGQIVCKTACPSITINFRPIGHGPAIQTVSKGGKYEFRDVLPGDYEVYVEPGLGWCWDRELQSVSLMTELTTVPTFTHSGYTLTIVSSHDTKVSYWPEEEQKDKQEMSLSPGSTHICVPRASAYIVEPSGCHGYPEPRVRWTSGAVHLTAATHANTFHIHSTHQMDDLVISVQTKRNGQEHTFQAYPKRGATYLSPSKSYIYEISLQLVGGDSAILVPSAGSSIFTPASLQVRGALDCANTSEPIFTAERGHIIAGRVTTGKNEGLGGVSISILDENENVISTQTTLENGTFVFPPRKIPSNYRLLAVKEGFVLTEQEKKGYFSAHKLAEIVVTVKDVKFNSPLQGVLLSLSGGKDYRRNAQTGAEGTLSFLSLSPGEYFIRPMMKEYRFHPQSKILTVAEGATVLFNLSGERVAYSGHGLVTSLNGEGEPGVTVEAVGLDNCSLRQEEASSGPGGLFRIRGLHPGCKYNIRVKEGPDVNQHIARSTPENITIEIEESDIVGVQLYAVRPEWRTDVMAYIVPDRPEDIKTLRLRLSSEESPDTTLHLAKLSDLKPTTSGYGLKSAVVALPPLAADGRSYIIRLESTLSLATHSYTNRPIHFKTDSSFKLIRLTFSPKPRVKEPELAQSSYLVLPLILVLTFIIYNKEKTLNLLTLVMQARLAPRPSQSEDSGSDSFVESNYQKKKTKSRKT